MSDETLLLYVHRPGCPFCRKIDPEWEKAVTMLNINTRKILRPNIPQWTVDTIQVETVPKFLLVQNKKIVSMFGDSSWKAEDVVVHTKYHKKQKFTSLRNLLPRLSLTLHL